MKKRLISVLLVLILALAVLPGPALAALTAEGTSHYFYDQLNPEAKLIYDNLKTLDLASGTANLDLTQVLGQEAVDRYIKNGDRTIPNDFIAAKDALDLDHSELWYLDSSYLTLRPTIENDGSYKAWIGIGRDDNYHLDGNLIQPGALQSMDQALNQAIAEIVDGARRAPVTGSTEEDREAAMVTYVHDQITRRISYRYENECRTGNGPYIRTIYALVTHEGVCEAYARSMQVILTKLGIQCVLVHGLQTSGTPEDHMWNAVRIGTKWYAVDATWDDPLVGDWSGKRADHQNGLDGKETNKYLLVGQSIIGANWKPSGIVSAGGYEFTYPTIERSSYAGKDLTQGDIRVQYSAGASMEDIASAVFTVTYKNMNAAQAEAQGYYFLIKMHQSYRDGTRSSFDQWYYVDAALALTKGSPFFTDTADGLRFYSGHCDYVELAITTRKPIGVETWNNAPETNGLSKDPETGFFNGTDQELIEETGMIYNPVSDYYAPPYVYVQDPGCNYNVMTGTTYNMKVTWDDTLYHPLNASDLGPIGTANGAPNRTSNDRDDRASAMAQRVRVKYITEQPDRDFVNGVRSELSMDPPYDTDRDGYVDDNFITYHYKTELCPHNGEAGHVCNVSLGCPIDGLNFNFTPSVMWADDLTRYTFTLEGMVGSRSWKVPNIWEVTTANPGACPACYRSQGIDWNLWGRPLLMDNFSDLDLSEIQMKGVDGHTQTLADLQQDMKIDDMNGRLMLVAEDISYGVGSREKYEEVSGALTDRTPVTEGDIKSSTLYEINFTRLCSMIMAKTGDSMRIQIGYPAGYQYNDADLGKVVFKAYHFTRNDAGEIISVEELPVILTPYGMVVMVSSFSPFEIVALDPGSAAARDKSKLMTGTLSVTTDGNGTVALEGSSGTGYDDTVKLTPGYTYTFRATPKPGYTLGTVVATDSRELTVSKGLNNTFTVATASAIDDTNELLEVSFIPQALQQADEAAHRREATPTVCTHEHTYEITPAREATCTHAGITAQVQCLDCNQIVSTGSIIDALPHEFVYSASDRLSPTCTRDGFETGTCAMCRKTHTKVLSALGHSYVNGVCTRCGAKDASYTPPQPTKPWQNPFLDVPADAWYLGDLEYVNKRGLILGDNLGNFDPNDNIKTIQLMAILARVRNVDGAVGNDWYATSLDWALSHGITAGTEPEVNLTREEFVTMVYKSMGSPAIAGDLIKFPDASSVSHWAVVPMIWATKTGLILGDNLGALNPGSTITRAEATAILARMCRTFEL